MFYTTVDRFASEPVKIDGILDCEIRCVQQSAAECGVHAEAIECLVNDHQSVINFVQFYCSQGRLTAYPPIRRIRLLVCELQRENIAYSFQYR